MKKKFEGLINFEFKFILYYFSHFIEYFIYYLRNKRDEINKIAIIIDWNNISYIEGEDLRSTIYRWV